MRSRLFLLITALALLACRTSAQEPSSDISEGERLFALRVAPALEAKCVACHGQDEDQLESELRLLTRDELLQGGSSGERVLVPGRREESWLYLSATWEHEQLQMPPKENDRLDKESLEALGRWIDLGAPWPAPQRVAEIREQLSEGIRINTGGGLDAGWNERRYAADKLWAYQPLSTPQLPAASELPTANAVDLFINQRLVELDLRPAPRADRLTLVRRLYFDLLGLPPTPEQSQAFVNDPAPDEMAWQRLVEQLLSSPRFGEQWGRHWLDTVRYADSAGFANDYERPNAWRYRDYVARCINEDRPLDQFIQEQVAGDELDPENPENLVAVGFLRMGPWEQTGMSVDKVTRQQFLDDVTDVVGQTFLAHPLQCARCHDHKFDPIPTQDYYRIQAVFATTQFADREAEFLESENHGVFEQQRRYLQQRIELYQQLLRELDDKQLEAERAWYAERHLEYAPRHEKLKQGVPAEQIAPQKAGFEPQDFGLERIARKYLERHRWELDRYRPIAFSTVSGPTPSRRSVNSRIPLSTEPDPQAAIEQTAILTGGDPFSPGLPVTPGVLSVLVHMTHAGQPGESSQSRTITSQPAGRRLEFARWLTDPTRNPLTPRVMVNRLWQHHFGQGLVATSNNFGTSGAQPTHPQLLDHLARELIASGWSTKHVHRLIVTSEAYCRAQSHAPSSDAADRSELDAKDPNASSYAVFQGRRLAAEELRDSILAISGLLNLEVGGAPVRPDINAEVAIQPRQIMGTYAPVYQPSPLPEDRNRRTLYALRLRGLRDPMLEVFNQPSSDFPCERRDSSTVAPQALTLFNSPLSLQRALAMAERLLAEAPAADAEAIIQNAFQWVYSRDASAEELAACIAHWRAMQERHTRLQFADWLPPREVTREFVDENTGEQFSYTEPLEQNRDYVPDVSPAAAAPRTRGLAEVCLVLLSSNELLYVP